MSYINPKANTIMLVAIGGLFLLAFAFVVTCDYIKQPDSNLTRPKETR